jgi:hypothetical protein
MLKASTVWLSESLREVAGAEMVEIIEHWQDMMELKGCSDDFRRGGSAVFAITGGTIGNVSEQAFVNSVDAISHPGDLLIISADTIDGASSSIVEKDLLKKYDHPGMRRFVAPSIHALIGEMKLSESSESIFERLQISLSPAKKAGLSDVDDSYAVTLCVEAGGWNVTLLSSTRYRLECLNAFAATFGWVPISVTESPLNSQFKQFLFRRKDAAIFGKDKPVI